ncbi:MAG: tripartite tricarboxylate transporter permease [Alphaproteobacteria bacterium]|nr:tripartite tricarboxylate transporter permease [Alphaproteobacteria bacterium]
MMDLFLQGAATLFSSPLSIGIFFAGLIGGLLFGAIPGVSMLTLAAIFLPFSGYLSAADAIMFYSVLYCSGTYGGAVTAILFNIPGSPENAPTAFDGYPMTQQGRAGKAIGAAVICSALGGTASVIFMMLATPLLADIAVVHFGPPEIFALVFFGIAVASSVGAKTLWKGWLSVLLGLLLATVGLDPVAGEERYIFDLYYLMAGLHFVPVILGFFAVAEVLVQAERRVSGSFDMPKFGTSFPTLAEFLSLKWAVARSVVLGFFAGILPGIGATLAAFLSYNEAVRWSKTPEKFGKGELEGVVASETANNAATGAAMIPLLALGLPGGALTAMMVGVFQMHDIEPGPLVFINSSDLVWVVFAAMFFANIAILVLGFVETKTVLHLLRIPFQVLAPGILLMSTVGAYATRSQVVDVAVMFAAGILAYFMRRTGYSVPGIVLGLILGRIGEQTFAQGMQMVSYDVGDFVTRPIVAVLLLAGISTVLTSVYRALKGSRKELNA